MIVVETLYLKGLPSQGRPFSRAGHFRGRMGDQYDAEIETGTDCDEGAFERSARVKRTPPGKVTNETTAQTEQDEQTTIREAQTEGIQTAMMGNKKEGECRQTPSRGGRERPAKRKKENSYHSSPELGERDHRVKDQTVKQIREINIAIEEIIKNTSMESGGRLSLTKANQVAVRDATIRLQTNLSFMANRLGKLEEKLSRTDTGEKELEKGTDLEGTMRLIVTEITKSREIEKQICDTVNKQQKLIEKLKSELEDSRRTNKIQEMRKIRKRQTRRREGNETSTQSESEAEEIENITSKEGTVAANNTIKTDGEIIKAIRDKETKELGLQGRTYARATAEGARNPQREEDKEWTTPPKTKQHRLTISKREETSKIDLMKTLKTKIDVKELNGPLKSVYRTRRGDLVVECRDENQKNKIKEKLKSEEELTTAEDKIRKPTFMLTGIDSGYRLDEIVEEIVGQNPEMTEFFGNEVGTKMRTLTGKKCRNPERTNWIIEAEPEVFKYIVKRGKIHFDFLEKYVEEIIRPQLCLKCSGYGHVAKHCNNVPKCYKCGGEHEGRECARENELECPACKIAGLTPRRHTAIDSNCPVRKRRVILERRRTNYSSEREGRRRPC